MNEHDPLSSLKRLRATSYLKVPIPEAEPPIDHLEVHSLLDELNGNIPGSKSPLAIFPKGVFLHSITKVAQDTVIELPSSQMHRGDAPKNFKLTPGAWVIIKTIGDGIPTEKDVRDGLEKIAQGRSDNLPPHDFEAT